MRLFDTATVTRPTKHLGPALSSRARNAGMMNVTRKFVILLRSRRARRGLAAGSVMKDTSFFLANLSAELRFEMFQRPVGGPGPSMNIFWGELHTCIVPFLRCSHILGQPTGRRTDVLVYTVCYKLRFKQQRRARRWC